MLDRDAWTAVTGDPTRPETVAVVVTVTIAALTTAATSGFGGTSGMVLVSVRGGVAVGVTSALGVTRSDTVGEAEAEWVTSAVADGPAVMVSGVDLVGVRTYDGDGVGTRVGVLVEVRDTERDTVAEPTPLNVTESDAVTM